jgi:hypothetical protein
MNGKTARLIRRCALKHGINGRIYKRHWRAANHRERGKLRAEWRVFLGRLVLGR